MVESFEIPGYTDFRLIGSGGSAAVLRARQVQLERDVAVKVLRPGQIDDQTRRLFDAERRALGKMGHPNIVTVFDSGYTSDGDPYLVMQLCASGALSALVKADGPLTVETASRVGLRISEALDYAHQQGMIHRDVKPENILISDRGEAILSDFGIAAVLDLDGSTSDLAMSPHHVAPELLKGAIASPSSDLYSLGSTVFYLLTGRSPHQNFIGERLSINEVLARVSDASFEPQIPVETDVPREVRNLLRSLLAKDPRRRVASAADAASSFASAEIALGTNSRKVLLPLRTHSDVFDRGSADPEATIFGKPQSVAYLEPARGSSSSVSLASTSDSRRVRTVTPTARHSDDVDLTIVAGAAKARQLIERPVALDPIHSGSGIDESKKPVSGRTIGLVALVLALLAVAVTVVVRRTGSANRVEPTPPNSDAAIAVEGPLSAPSDVVLRSIGTNAIEASWIANSDPGVQYQIEVSRKGEIVQTLTIAQPPTTISGLDLSQWVPCVVVSAVDSAASRIASSEPICAELAPLDPDAPAALPLSIIVSNSAVS
jgi:serine/threonine protein kinase